MVINIITLGCSKNLVDSEYLLRQLHTNGHKVLHDETKVDADVVILNTCGFILDAKEESINSILHYTALKKQGRVGKVIVMGCLSERYSVELKKEMPEVDGFFGVWDQKEIISSIGASYFPEMGNDRIITTLPHTAFLKISEGCNRRCAFCAIPGIRGNQRSKQIHSLLDETKTLADRGSKEIILIAQDLTNYGIDIRGRRELAELLKRISAVELVEWIRMHYAFPTGFQEEVIDLMANDPKICNYLDIPIQHVNDRILSLMNRGHNRKQLEKLLNNLRKKVPGVALRTTLLVGFPGETDEEFEELYQFVEATRFDRLGVFPYSREDDTPSAKLTDDVPQAVKEERAGRIMELQQKISLEINQEKIGKTFKVLVDSEESEYFIGRTEHDSPEVDNEVFIEKISSVKPGDFAMVKITDAAEFDLTGTVVS
ncbi:MAG: 30S ribosomal protein S12 methylthiotransferase RimO [Bacteroidales bacterium]